MALCRFRRDNTGTSMEPVTWVDEDTKARDFFAGTFAVRDGMALVGATGADYGAVLLERNASGDRWNKRARLIQEAEALDLITGSQVDCQDGTAASFACSNVDLVSFLPLSAMGAARGVRLNALNQAAPFLQPGDDGLPVGGGKRAPHVDADRVVPDVV